MKKIILMLVLGLFSFSAFAEIKIGFVDVRRAVESTKAGQKVKKDLEEDFKKREAALNKKAQDIEKKREEFETKRLVWSDDKQKEKQEELQRLMMTFNEEAEKNNLELRRQEQSMMEPIFKKMQEVINDIAEKDKYTLIMQNRENILWAKEEINLTDRVVKEFEKK